jgi:hypothetical protein
MVQQLKAPEYIRPEPFEDDQAVVSLSFYIAPGVDDVFNVHVGDAWYPDTVLNRIEKTHKWAVHLQDATQGWDGNARLVVELTVKTMHLPFLERYKQQIHACLKREIAAVMQNGAPNAEKT